MDKNKIIKLIQIKSCQMASKKILESRFSMGNPWNPSWMIGRSENLEGVRIRR